jgi:methyltransferase (TIGR00027 family)
MQPRRTPDPKSKLLAVSSTALFVANGLWWVSNHPSLSVEVPERMAMLNHAMVRHLNTGIFSIRNRFSSALLRLKTSLMQKIAMPGFYLHFALRKRCIEDHVRAALSQDAQQLIVLGAGFDTLSLRISQDFPEIQVIEIDHSATQRCKGDALNRLEHRFENLNLIPLDLTQNTLHEILLQSEHYDSSKPAVFVAEGLFMYLQEQEVKELLGQIRRHSSSGSRLIFTYMEEIREGNFQFRNASRAVTIWLKMKREVFNWGLKNEQLSPFLDRSGYKLIACKTHQQLRDEYLSEVNSDAPLAIGENIVIATTH